MDSKEYLKSNDIEIAELHANLLWNKIGREVKDLLDKSVKYDYYILKDRVFLKKKTYFNQSITFLKDPSRSVLIEMK